MVEMILGVVLLTLCALYCILWFVAFLGTLKKAHKETEAEKWARYMQITKLR